MYSTWYDRSITACRRGALFIHTVGEWSRVGRPGTAMPVHCWAGFLACCSSVACPWPWWRQWRAVEGARTLAHPSFHTCDAPCGARLRTPGGRRTARRMREMGGGRGDPCFCLPRPLPSPALSLRCSWGLLGPSIPPGWLEPACYSVSACAPAWLPAWLCPCLSTLLAAQ